MVNHFGHTYLLLQTTHVTLLLLQAVLECDVERCELLAEEKQLMALLNKVSVIKCDGESEKECVTGSVIERVREWE